MGWKRPIVMAVTFACWCWAGHAHAADPAGMWLTEDSEAKVQIYACAQAFCGKIVWLKEPNDSDTRQPKLDKFNQDAGKRMRPVLGLEIMYGMKPGASPDQWQGSLYNPEDGYTYTGILIIQNMLNLKLQGCVLGGLICKSETWKRTN